MGAVLLVLSRLNQIKNIDPLARTATVQPGVRNSRFPEAAVKHKSVLRAGSIVADRLLDRRQPCGKFRRRALPEIRSHRAQHPQAGAPGPFDGQLLEIGSDTLDAAGYDLLALLTGSEGMLAVITEVTVKAAATPANAHRWCSLRSTTW